MRQLTALLVMIASFCCVAAGAHADSGVVTSITIRAPRDMGYFAGDLVRADIDLVVRDGYTLVEASLPHPGPIAYWLDLRSINVVSHAAGADRRYTLQIVYQNFYDALDARPQEIPTFPVTVTNGTDTVTADVPAWTIGVSSLREVAPPVKDDPRDYMRADEPATVVKVDPLWRRTAAAAIAMLLALALLARDRAWWPFHARPARVFGDAVRKLRPLAARREQDDAYLDALLVLHRAIDRTDGQRVLADDLSAFLRRHPLFSPRRDALVAFFAASRQAFFGSDLKRARSAFDFDALQTFTRHLAAIERTAP